jgi:outer membrane protein assembly factor BamB
MKRAVTIAVAALAVTACVGSETQGVPTSSAPGHAVQWQRFADGVTMEGGESGTLPVRVAWVVDAQWTESVATDGTVVFIVGDDVTAVDARDGRVLWVLDPYASGDHFLESYGLGASGGVVVGLADGGAVVRVYAPWEWDIELDRRTGRLLRSGPANGGDAPESRFEQLPPFTPSTYRFEQGERFDTADARLPSGELAFRLRLDPPTSVYALEVGGLIVLDLFEHVVALAPAP